MERLQCIAVKIPRRWRISHNHQAKDSLCFLSLTQKFKIQNILGRVEAALRPGSRSGCNIRLTATKSNGG
jgi:hypothetical protein